MQQKPLPKETFRFGAFELDLRSGELRRGEERIKLQPQPLEVLAFLATRSGQLVTREEIRQRVWEEGTFVNFEQGLNYCIRQIRSALSDSPDTPRYIETFPRRGYRFIAPVTRIPASAPPSAGRILLAVLPLDSLSDEPGQEYFSDGLTDEMISQLGRLCPERLGVIARTSIMQYKRTTKNIGQIADELSVEYLCEGTVRRQHDRVRVTAQLIRASDQTHVWADSFEAELRDVLVLQSQLASAIVNEIERKLTPGKGSSTPPAGRPVLPEAYEACLKGRYFWNRRSKDDLYRALEFFARAIECDPDYPEPFAGLADVHLTLLDYNLVSPGQALAQASAAAVSALRLDETLAAAHTSLAHAKFHAFEWEGSERRFRRAIALNPSYTTAHFYYANYLAARGRFDEAVAEATETLALDPVSWAAEGNLGITFYHAGRHDHGIAACRRALEMNSAFPKTHEDLGRILLFKGLADEALTAFRKAVALSGRDPRYLSSLAHALAFTGDPTEARRILAELDGLSGQRYVAAYPLAAVHLALGDKDRALEYLERAYEERSAALPFVNVEPRFAVLRGNSRFEGLLGRLHLGS